jgi:hypothetical protein
MISSVKPTLSIAHLTHTNEEHAYEIISIKGLSFYQSSGHQSNYPNTWFPFFGLLENTKMSLYRQGWFIKALETKLPQPIYKELMQLFPSYGGDAPGGRDLLIRFWNVPCLLLSSSLGGGLWDDPRGKVLKDFLRKEYPDFYQQVPTLTILPSIGNFPNHLDVNNWLCKQAKLNHYLDLQSQFPTTLADLLVHLQKPCEQPGPAKRKEPKNIVNEQNQEQKQSSSVFLFSLNRFLVCFGMGLLGYGLGLPVIVCVIGIVGTYGAVFTLERFRHPLQKTVSINNKVELNSHSVGKVAKTWLPSKLAEVKAQMPPPNTKHSPMTPKGIKHH